jgi:hypothetical protein
VGEAVARDKEGGIGREGPDEEKVKDRHVVAEVEEEVVPRPLLVLVYAHGEEIE